MNISNSLSASNPDLSLTNLTPSLQSESLPSSSPEINAKEYLKRKKTNYRVLQLFLDYWDYLKAALIAVLIAGFRASGPIPRHVAIIMDGNRRYAKKKGFTHVSEGHFEGAKTLEKVRNTYIHMYIHRSTYIHRCLIMDSGWVYKVSQCTLSVSKISSDQLKKLAFLCHLLRRSFAFLARRAN